MRKKSSQYYGVTERPRKLHDSVWRVQFHINGSPRFIGEYDDEEEAGFRAELTRTFLQDFFPDPPPERQFMDRIHDGPWKRVEDLRQQLTEEGAPTYDHSARFSSPVTPASLTPRELTEQLQTLAQSVQDALQRLAALEAAQHRAPPFSEAPGDPAPGDPATPDQEAA